MMPPAARFTLYDPALTFSIVNPLVSVRVRLPAPPVSASTLDTFVSRIIWPFERANNAPPVTNPPEAIETLPCAISETSSVPALIAPRIIALFSVTSSMPSPPLAASRRVTSVRRITSPSPCTVSSSAVIVPSSCATTSPFVTSMTSLVPALILPAIRESVSTTVRSPAPLTSAANSTTVVYRLIAPDPLTVNLSAVIIPFGSTVMEPPTSNLTSCVPVLIVPILIASVSITTNSPVPDVSASRWFTVVSRMITPSP